MDISAVAVMTTEGPNFFKPTEFAKPESYQKYALTEIQLHVIYNISFFWNLYVIK